MGEINLVYIYKAAMVTPAKTGKTNAICPLGLLKASVSNGPKKPSVPAVSVIAAASLVRFPSNGSTTVLITGVTVPVTLTPEAFFT